MNNTETITGLEADAILWALDTYYGCTPSGHVILDHGHGHSLEFLQQLRDKLFAIHEHPEDQER